MQSLAYGVMQGGRKLALLTILLTLSMVPAKAEIVIAALGDSLTQGYGLAEEDGFVPQLESWLHENGAPDVRIINAGVSGDTTAGGLARIDWTLSDEVDAVIVTLGGNDLLRGIDPSASRANLDAILTAIDAKGLPALLAGMPAPSNYGPDYKAEFDAIYPELAEAHGALLYPDFLAGLGDRSDPQAIRALMQGDFLHPNAEGVKRIVADIGSTVLDLVTAARAAKD
jgi:acyl-CoA thioesterase I